MTLHAPLDEISKEFRKVAERIRKIIPQVRIKYSKLNNTEYITKLLIEYEQLLSN